VILDEEGHAHLTDFNIATILEEGEMAVSISGTKPYMGNLFSQFFVANN
jgi:serine/threonine kinase 32